MQHKVLSNSKLPIKLPRSRSFWSDRQHEIFHPIESGQQLNQQSYLRCGQPDPPGLSIATPDAGNNRDLLVRDICFCSQGHVGTGKATPYSVDFYTDLTSKIPSRTPPARPRVFLLYAFSEDLASCTLMAGINLTTVRKYLQ
jgi:hypothetical protein